MTIEKKLPRDLEVQITTGIILSLITCGLYNLYWNYLQFKAMNILLEREEYDFVKWILLTIITCGIYHIYYEYKMGSDLYMYLKSKGVDVNPNLPVIGLILAIFGLSIVTDAIYQHEINRFVA